MDLKLHKIMLSKILLAIYKNNFLSQILWFKWWTAGMFFYDLPRFSVDLDFDVFEEINKENKKKIIENMQKILKNFWEITDFADKKNTILFEIRYKNNEKRLKVEISKRWKSGEFQIKNFLWENIFVITEQDLFTNKMIALLNRKWIANRDIFDIRFFLQKWVDLNKELIENFTNKKFEEYLTEVKYFITSYDFSKILYWLWEMLNEKQKNFCRTKMKDEILWFLEFYLKAG